MFRGVLVANRGEIALRIFRACRELGIPTVGVYSEADRSAPWLDLADQAFLIGPAAPGESYLDTAKVLDAAERAGADAVHPGYGFLSENADFAEAVTAAGLTWIGPPPSAIRSMGDKLSAREVAQAAEVPLVPGTMEPTTDPDVVRAFAAEHGFPVAIKAAYGGGGRGLKVVRAESELVEALEGAQREAVAAFGRGEVYVERYLTRPRHIEIQVLADAHGTTLHLGERDCSTQRRHQKLIEEAPAPGLPAEIREAMGAAAIRVSEEVGYTGAGTCEFLYEDGDFFFLEMNTRLQVEHPVTEIVTGIDLVHAQLRIAAGEPLGLSQDDIVLRGHAIEVRINAEDPGAGFAPAPGLVSRWVEPSGPGVRVDAGVRSGWEIPRTYDSMIAKLITSGGDRDTARRRMVRALDELVVEGVPTTATFHRFAMVHDDVIEGRVSTVSVEREWDLSSLTPAEAPAEGDGPMQPSKVVTVEVGGRRIEVALFDPSSAPVADGRRNRARSARRTGSTGSNDLTAPMQGTIIKTAVEVGATVSAGDLVVVLEAMKMENHVTAHRDGVVSALAVEAGAVVNAGDVLATIEEPD